MFYCGVFRLELRYLQAVHGFRSGMSYCVAGLVVPDVSKEPNALIYSEG
jgi:hypothetical protein